MFPAALLGGLLTSMLPSWFRSRRVRRVTTGPAADATREGAINVGSDGFAPDTHVAAYHWSKSHRSSKLAIAAYALLALLFATGSGEPPGIDTSHRFTLQESRIQIFGSSSVNMFRCEAGASKGYLTHYSAPQASQIHISQSPAAVLTIPVASISCGDRRMDRDLYRALKANDFPEIEYELIDVEVLNAPSNGDSTHDLRATGNLAVAGVSRQIETLVKGSRLPDGRLRAVGVEDLIMSDFGIERPSALFGLIKARDRLDIRFDLIAAPQSEPADSAGAYAR